MRDIVRLSLCLYIHNYVVVSEFIKQINILYDTISDTL